MAVRSCVRPPGATRRWQPTRHHDAQPGNRLHRPRVMARNPVAAGHRPRGHAGAARRTGPCAQARARDAGRPGQPRRHGRAHLHAQPVRAARLLRAHRRPGRCGGALRGAGALRHRGRSPHARGHRRHQHAPWRDLHAGVAVCFGGCRRKHGPQAEPATAAAHAAGALGRRAGGASHSPADPARRTCSTAGTACAVPRRKPRSACRCCSRRRCRRCRLRRLVAWHGSTCCSTRCSTSWRCWTTATSRIEAAWRACAMRSARRAHSSPPAEHRGREEWQPRAPSAATS